MGYQVAHWDSYSRGEKKKKISVGKDVGKSEPLCFVDRNVRWCNHCGIVLFLKTVNTVCAGSPLLDIYSKRLEERLKHISTPMSTATL